MENGLGQMAGELRRVQRCAGPNQSELGALGLKLFCNHNGKPAMHLSRVTKPHPLKVQPEPKKKRIKRG